MISKSNKRAARVRFEITSMISDENCTTRISITTLLQPLQLQHIDEIIVYFLFNGFIDVESLKVFDTRGILTTPASDVH